MSSMITLGFEALPLTVRLAEGARFAAALIAQDGWPADAQIRLEFPRHGQAPLVWNATIDGPTAAWSVPAADVDLVLEAKLRRARVTYREAAGDPLLWMTGSVVPQ
jgi:hypothetical protein